MKPFSEHNYESTYPVIHNKRSGNGFKNPQAPVHIVTGKTNHTKEKKNDYYFQVREGLQLLILSEDLPHGQESE